MADTKYGKYFLREPWGIPNRANPDPNAPVYIGIGQGAPVKGWDEPLTQVLRPIYRPYFMIPKSHHHNCSEILYFIGGNPMNFKDFGAECELVMGEGKDAETFTITSTTWVYVPPDLPHCPLNFKRVDRPIMFGHIMFAPTYESTTAFNPNAPGKDEKK
jgi:mannose-6-phosphate isomerase-like protein (cupin superfamily)